MAATTHCRLHVYLFTLGFCCLSLPCGTMPWHVFHQSRSGLAFRYKYSVNKYVRGRKTNVLPRSDSHWAGTGFPLLQKPWIGKAIRARAHFCLFFKQVPVCRLMAIITNQLVAGKQVIWWVGWLVGWSAGWLVGWSRRGKPTQYVSNTVVWPKLCVSVFVCVLFVCFRCLLVRFCFGWLVVCVCAFCLLVYMFLC